MRRIVYLLMLVSSTSFVFTGENNLFEVIQVDDRNDRINSIYLTIDSTLLHQENQVNTIVQDLIKEYEITEHTSYIF
jgi:signal transduction protein with GAF and PtsI domain